MAKKDRTLYVLKYLWKNTDYRVRDRYSLREKLSEQVFYRSALI